MSESTHFRVTLSVRAFDQDFAMGDLIEVPASEAARYAAFWMQMGSSPAYAFVEVSDDELAELTAPAPVVPEAPPPSPEALRDLRLEDLRALADAVPDVETKTQDELIAAITSPAPPDHPAEPEHPAAPTSEESAP